MRGPVWLLLLAGCDQTFNLDHINSIDASTFGIERCPQGYDIVSPLGGSRYRVNMTLATAWVQSDMCRDDSAGFTHLVATETVDEHAFVRDELGKALVPRWYIGAVQNVTVAQSPGDAWLWVSGGPFKLAWTPNEPNDGDDSETSHDEQFAFMEGVKLGDASGLDPMAALCECDGRAVTMAAATAIELGHR